MGGFKRRQRRWIGSLLEVVNKSNNYRSDKNFIDAIIDKDSENEFRLTGFYGEPEIARRIEVWNKLRDLNSQPHIPCLCFGDFNEIIRQDEKLGAAIRPHNQMHLLEML